MVRMAPPPSPLPSFPRLAFLGPKRIPGGELEADSPRKGSCTHTRRARHVRQTSHTCHTGHKGRMCPAVHAIHATRATHAHSKSFDAAPATSG